MAFINEESHKRSVAMKKKLLFVFIILVFAVMFFAFFLLLKSDRMYSNSYYEVSCPKALELEVIREDAVYINKDGTLWGTLTVYPESVFGSSASSIVTNIYGMHAYLECELSVEEEIAGLMYCIVVGHEPTVTQQDTGTFGTEYELHYIYMDEAGTIVDFATAYPVEDGLTETLAKSLKLTGAQ